MRRILIACVALPFVVLSGLFSFGVIRIYRNSTSSMEPALPMGARFLTILTDGANRGDIVAFVYPLDPRVLFAKRVVAVGGDVVEIRDKRLFINGHEVKERYAVHTDPTVYPNDKLLPEPYRSRDHFDPFRVPAGTFFVLGDSRDQSSDSRYWGTVPRENIRGRVFLEFSWSRGFWKPH